MTDKVIVYIAIILIYYNISGLATTNIIRLTKGNTLSINAKECRCDVCNSKIKPLLQLPIISFIICKGKCLNCGSKIPLFPLILEIVLLLGMSSISALCKFSVQGVVWSFGFYELTRVVVVLIRGKRENSFFKEYVVAVISMLLFLVLTMFVAFLGANT